MEYNSVIEKIEKEKLNKEEILLILKNLSLENDVLLSKVRGYFLNKSDYVRSVLQNNIKEENEEIKNNCIKIYNGLVDKNKEVLIECLNYYIRKNKNYEFNKNKFDKSLKFLKQNSVDGINEKASLAVCTFLNNNLKNIYKRIDALRKDNVKSIHALSEKDVIDRCKDMLSGNYDSKNLKRLRNFRNRMDKNNPYYLDLAKEIKSYEGNLLVRKNMVYYNQVFDAYINSGVIDMSVIDEYHKKDYYQINRLFENYMFVPQSEEELEFYKLFCEKVSLFYYYKKRNINVVANGNFQYTAASIAYLKSKNLSDEEIEIVLNIIKCNNVSNYLLDLIIDPILAKKELQR